MDKRVKHHYLEELGLDKSFQIPVICPSQVSNRFYLMGHSFNNNANEIVWERTSLTHLFI